MRKPKRKKSPLSLAERKKLKAQRDHIRQIRLIFRNAGFQHIAELEGKEFTFKGSTTDIDDVFLLENVIILTEYTTHGEDHVAGHLLNKKIIFDKINDDQEGFAGYLKGAFSGIQGVVKPVYGDHLFKIVILYCSMNNLKDSTKLKVSGVVFFDFAYVKYFLNVSGTVKKSAKYEMLDFLGVKPAEFAERAVSPQSSTTLSYEGSVLPDANSHFSPGYKIVSFYVDAAALLERAYVLRRDGWRTGGNIYQRMIDRKKVEAIRKHLLDKKGVFINNIIVTLPDNTKLLDNNGDTIRTSQIKKTTPGRVQLSTEFSSIGIIDGQHRVFSYHEGGTREEEIAALRVQQNLLVTGVMFPNGAGELERAQFEARLFLEINSNQSNAKAELKQEIGLILRPFAVESVARRVLNRINEGNGPLSGEFEKYFWEKGKIKTTSIVSYGLIPLIRVSDNNGLFARWENQDKSSLLKSENESVLKAYIEFCAREINIFVGAVRSELPKERWTADRATAGRLLTTTVVNGLIACLRQLAIHDKLGSFEHYKAAVNGIDKFDFKKYKSSHYNNMGRDLAKMYFSI